MMSLNNNSKCVEYAPVGSKRGAKNGRSRREKIKVSNRVKQDWTGSKGRKLRVCFGCGGACEWQSLVFLILASLSDQFSCLV